MKSYRKSKYLLCNSTSVSAIILKGLPIYCITFLFVNLNSSRKCQANIDKYKMWFGCLK